MQAAVDVYVMPLAGGDAWAAVASGSGDPWDVARSLVAPRYRRLSSGKAPERVRLGELAAGLLMARYLGVSTDEALTVGDEGKPRLAAEGPEFNLSHDDGAAVLALCEQTVGVDVEDVPRAYGEPQNAALRAVLSAKELVDVESAADPARAFARAWTRVEATLKADGRGFAFRTKGGNLPGGWQTRTADLSLEGGRHAMTVATRDVPQVTLHEVSMAEAIAALLHK